MDTNNGIRIKSAAVVADLFWEQIDDSVNSLVCSNYFCFICDEMLKYDFQFIDNLKPFNSVSMILFQVSFIAKNN